ncbi:MAG: response regulator [Candidatus Odinarchaeota archaeon]
MVEDDEALHELYTKVLELEDHEVIAHAYDGEEALEIFADLDPKPDLIILDHRMPRKSGLETLEELKRIDNNVAVVIISADCSIQNRALELGAASFKKKPVRLEEILDLARNAKKNVQSCHENVQVSSVVLERR